MKYFLGILLLCVWVVLLQFPFGGLIAYGIAGWHVGTWIGKFLAMWFPDK